MKKKNLLIFTSTIIGSVIVMTSALLMDNSSIVQPVFGDDPPYTLTLNSLKKITINEIASGNEVSNSIRTSLNNNITFSGYNIINNNEGWQTILPNGYVYNPCTNDSHKNQISGIKSIRYSGNGSLELHYGYLSNNNTCLYSLEEELVANEEYIFSNNYPSYIYLKNTSAFNININELTIKYSCVSELFPNNSLTVLMIGNSFADDTIYHASNLASQIGLNLEIYNSYIGGCTINTHYSNITSGNAAYSMRSMNGANWVYHDNMSLNDIVTSHTWDIITFQQASAEIGRHESYSNLENLVNEVKSLVSGNPKYYWHQTWAYDSDYSEWNDYFSYFNNDQEAMFNAIVDCYNDEVVPLNIFEKTIFNGTAVQNLRTSFMKDTFSRDGKHMSIIHGRYLLSVNLISTIFNIDLKLSNFNTPVNYMNESFVKVALESIENARRFPNVITNSVYTETEIADYDLSNYTEIDAGLVGCSYYYSQDGSNYNKRNNHTKDTSNIYSSTYRFTSETLPVGSIVFIQEGLGYRPEAWIDDSPQSFRMDEAYNNVLEITDEFWDGYLYRAFNIFKSGKPKLSGEYVDQQYEDIFDGFHIFVPNNKMAGLTPKTYNPSYESDKTAFESHGLNIDQYERIHLDPITGFYKCDSYYYLMNSYVDDTAQKFVCTRPFYTSKNDLGAGTVIIIDSGFQYRSDCWGEKATYSPRPNNVTTNFTILDVSFMSPFRRRTFNVSSTNSYYVRQNSIEFMNHLRIYQPII